MGIKTFSPTSQSRRGMTGFDFSEITKTKAEKSLVEKLHRKAGRSNTGQVSIRHKGGNGFLTIETTLVDGDGDVVVLARSVMVERDVA